MIEETLDDYIGKPLGAIKVGSRLVGDEIVFNITPYVGWKGHAWIETIAPCRNANEIKSRYYIVTEDSERAVQELRGLKLIGIITLHRGSHIPFDRAEEMLRGQAA